MEAKLEQDEKGQSRWRRELARFCTPVFLEAFVLTFLAEWGDRSQIATISLAAQHDPCALRHLLVVRSNDSAPVL